MTPVSRAKPGMSANPPYPSSLREPALADFVELEETTQRCLDEAFAELEWRPWPEDALVLARGQVFAVNRCNLWIIYERDDEARALEVWRLLV